MSEEKEALYVLIDFKERLKAAAKASGEGNLSSWVRRVLKAEADKVLADEQSSV